MSFGDCLCEQISAYFLPRRKAARCKMQDGSNVSRVLVVGLPIQDFTDCMTDRLTEQTCPNPAKGRVPA